MGMQISGAESHRRMSGEGQLTFQCQWKEKLCKEQKSTGQRTDLEHERRWEQAQRCGCVY